MKTKCKHGHRLCRCAECGGASTCPHGRHKYQCVDCKGNGVCSHLRQRSYCPRCKPEGVYRSYRNSAVKRGLVFELPYDIFVAMMNSPCIYCGQTPSLGIDRADNAIGYQIENCLPCCNVDNLAKRTLSQDQYLEHIAKVYKFQSGAKS